MSFDLKEVETVSLLDEIKIRIPKQHFKSEIEKLDENSYFTKVTIKIPHKVWRDTKDTLDTRQAHENSI